MSRRVHRDLEHLADAYPELCRDATEWGEARRTITKMQAKWGGLARPAAQLYHLGLSVSAIARVLGMHRRNVYRELYRWAEKAGLAAPGIDARDVVRSARTLQDDNRGGGAG